MRVPGFHDGAAPPPGRDQRAPARGAGRAACRRRPGWHAGLGEVPSGPLLLIANEFFDALPVHQLIAHGAGWVERCVDLDAEAQARLPLGRTPSPLGADLPERPAGTVAEVSPARSELAREIGRRIAGRRRGGAGDRLRRLGRGADRRHPAGHARPRPVRPARCARHRRSYHPRRLSGVGRGRSRRRRRGYGPVPQGTFLTRARHPPAHGEADRTGDAGPAPRVARGPVPPDRRERHGRAVQGAGARRA